MAKMLCIDPQKCVACRMCELACSVKFEGQQKPTASRIQMHLFLDEFFYLPITCFQCEKAPCLESCPVNCISRNEEGVVVVDADTCIGCKMCVLACPFGTMLFCAGTEGEHGCERPHAVKCELCDGQPECVLFCPTGAITYAEPDIGARERQKAVARMMANALKEVSIG